jgi:deoxyadenosine/deoxycytidine kinase
MAANDSAAAKRARTPQRGPQTPRFIVIEGPLRVGKTTLAKILAERLHARRIYDCEDNPFLADFYNAKPGSAFRAQMYFLLERQKRLREALAVEAPGPVLSDFLMEKDRIFANLNLDDEELKLYDRYYAAFTADIPAPDLVIYLQAKPEVLRARIAKKASRDESHIAPEYIEEVARAYEHFFFRYAASDLLVINTSDIDFVERSEDLQQLLRRLQDPMRLGGVLQRKHRLHEGANAASIGKGGNFGQTILIAVDPQCLLADSVGGGSPASSGAINEPSSAET